MKFLFTCSFYPPYSFGGDGIHVKYLAEALVQKGHEVYVLTSSDAYKFKRDDFNQKIIEDNGVNVFRIETKYYNWHCFRNYSFGSSKIVMDEFKRLVKEIKPDVVHHHNISLLGWNILKKVGNYRNIYTAHDYWLICVKYDLLRGWKECKKNKNFINCSLCCTKHLKPYQIFRLSKNFKDALNDIDLVIAPSRFMADRLKDKFNVEILYNFVPNPLKAGKSEFNDYYLFIGALEEHKGVKELVEMFKDYKGNLVIAGGGSLVNYINNLKEENIHYIGWVDGERKYSIISNARALILPSKWPENMPLVALEALSCGVPVFGSNYGGVPEILEKFKGMPFFEHGSKKLIKNLNEVEKIKKSDCKQVFKKNFSTNSFLKKYFNLLKQL